MQYHSSHNKKVIAKSSSDIDIDYLEKNDSNLSLYKIPSKQNNDMMNLFGITESIVRNPNLLIGKEKQKFGKWALMEQINFLKAIREYGKNWKKISNMVKTRSGIQLRSHYQKLCNKLKKHFHIEDAILFIQSRKLSILEMIEIINKDVYEENDIINRSFIRIDIAKIENIIISDILTIIWKIMDVFKSNEEIVRTYPILNKILIIMHKLKNINSRHIQHFSQRVKKFIKWLLNYRNIFNNFYHQSYLNSDLVPLEMIKEIQIIGSSFKMNSKKVKNVQNLLSKIYFLKNII